MKIKLLLSLTLLAGSIFANDKVTVKSTLHSVTVYTQGAQLQHKANYTIKAGLSEVIVEGISPQIAAGTIQVKATGAVVILDSKYEYYYPQPKLELVARELPPKIKSAIKAIEDSIKLVNFELRDINDEIADQEDASGLDKMQEAAGVLAHLRQAVAGDQGAEAVDRLQRAAEVADQRGLARGHVGGRDGFVRQAPDLGRGTGVDLEGRDGRVHLAVDDEGEVWIGGQVQPVIEGQVTW